jgi:hypothetical protein
MTHDQIVGCFCGLAGVNTVLLAWMAWSFFKSSNAFLEMVWDDAYAQGMAKALGEPAAPPPET